MTLWAEYCDFLLLKNVHILYLFCKAEKSKDVGDHWNSLQHKHHGKEMEVKNFCFQRLGYFKIWSLRHYVPLSPLCIFMCPQGAVIKYKKKSGEAEYRRRTREEGN